MHGLIRATTLRGYEQLVTELGGDPAPLLRRYHLPSAGQQVIERFIPYRNAALLFETSAAELDCPDFGLRLSRYQGWETLGPVAVIARNARTVLDACRSIARYLYTHSPALSLELRTNPADGSLQFNYWINELNLQQNRQAYELSLANGLQLLRLPAGRQLRLCRVGFRHSRMADASTYRQVFGCTVEFDREWCGFQIDADLANQTIDQADAETHRLATAYLEDHYAARGQHLTERVRGLIEQLLPTGQCTARNIADHLSLHPRTLQRRLADEGQRYDTLLDTVRRDQADYYLRQRGLYLSQVSGLLGYAEQSAFNRACRRWFNTTPRAYRSRLQ
ncbi:AraC family transcriptional regulator [Parahaliea aestuarii]|uniref:AraC family transcriptional regulator n=1 Tax=Parahaliea aestuarii TaxID=1852021 RepID=A0A5C8ZQ29_9GAMM|nr:AraC family transcriptional regulator [Parahaliea aestuarii]TXS89607.1 AraC family transcriptional regulator [Parahaliea aestuarii]